MKTRVVGRCRIAKSAQLGHSSIVGKPFRKLLTGEEGTAGGTVIARGVEIGAFCIVGARTIVGENTILDDRSTIETDVTIGYGCLIIYGAQICAEAEIGDDCVIGGFVGERTRIGNNSRIFGQLVHTQHSPTLGWDDDCAQEPSANIHHSVFIGFNSVIAGPVEIGPHAYVCSGAIVTRKVPPLHIAFGKNQLVHHRDWKGPLSRSPIFAPS